MAKRKRLSLPDSADSPALEAKSAPNGWVGIRRSPAPIADMAGAASATAALEDLAQEMQDARAQGRMVISVPLEQIDVGYLVRDRTALDEEDLVELMTSLAARGQQAPIEVVNLPTGVYGLVSGWRRLTALQRLHAETGEAQYSHIKCLLRSPETASEAYLSMVEENEIRAPLSFYERAHVASKAAEQGAFDTPRAAVKALFAAASPSKRSKIHGFGVLYDHLDPVLRFGRDIPEHLGLALAKALESDVGLSKRLVSALADADAQSAAQERAVLEAALRTHAPEKRKKSVAGAETARAEITTGVSISAAKGRVVLSGAGVTEQLIGDLKVWLKKNAGQ
ncbi:MAG: ParB N-terminal domain-containing protein [Tateyamaria sp.]|uniref:ParB/RepB/Spo0J family partition protein n=1 Tax=Tateyamaria sp. TaxID=1929288 RepID=UPI00329C2FE3